MEISIFGTGYVGLVTGACLSEVGHNINCIDIDREKINQLNQGSISIYEPGLESIVKNNLKIGKLKFFTDPQKPIKDSDVIMIAVGTPSDTDGSSDLQYVLKVAKTIGQLMESSKIIVIKSTVPVGTSDILRETIQKELNKRSLDIKFSLASNPEFLKEGDAVSDFMKPDRIILGCEDKDTEKTLRNLYNSFCRDRDRCIIMDIKSSEFTKYASNAMLATKISFMNDLSQIAERVDVDIEKVRIGIGSDNRIGHSFIYPGIGFGGSCFPKDVKALIAFSKELNINSDILQSVLAINDTQFMSVFNVLNKELGTLEGKKISILGLSFKPETDDIRDAISLKIIKKLLDKKAIVRVYDPIANDSVKDVYGKSISYSSNSESCIKGSECCIIVTEWKEFKSLKPKDFTRLMKRPLIIDGRRIFSKKMFSKLEYHAIGLG